MFMPARDEQLKIEQLDSVCVCVLTDEYQSYKIQEGLKRQLLISLISM